MQLPIAGSKMSGAIRCAHFANAVVQRKLNRRLQYAVDHCAIAKNKLLAKLLDDCLRQIENVGKLSITILHFTHFSLMLQNGFYY